jgi:hypothetical protein
LKRVKTIALLLLIAALLSFLQLNILPNGISFSRRMQAFNQLKNRTSHPQEIDYNDEVTLSALLHPGDDRGRWSETSAARIEGYVVSVRYGSIEAANCFSLFRRDTHIGLALSKDASPRTSVELEVTPRLRRWAKEQGWDWSTEALARELVGHWCQFEGWLLFDIGHDEESENTNPGGVTNWRATAWEIHPVTSIKIIK